jgi:hypothetical protein
MPPRFSTHHQIAPNPERVLLAISRLRGVLVESECKGNHTRVQLIVITAVWRKGKRRRRRKKKKKKGQQGEEQTMTVRLKQTAPTVTNIEAERQTSGSQSQAAIPAKASAAASSAKKPPRDLQSSKIF